MLYQSKKIKVLSQSVSLATTRHDLLQESSPKKVESKDYREIAKQG